MATTDNRISVLHVGPEQDPFVSAPQEPQRHRYSLYATGSPTQTKGALEAHLAETERRLNEASELGTVLVQQRREIEERLKEVEQQQNEDEIGPELRKKLEDLEREVNEVGRETARAFLPKARVPSGESDTTGSTSIFSSDATGSPSKVSAPMSRKQRNQPTSRVLDIKLATEISSSLLQQIRELQDLLNEKDEVIREAGFEKVKLEDELEGLNQRVRALDESEQRYRDENWNLETQLHEFIATSKDSSEREKRLAQGLSASNTQKLAFERELEEIKQTHSKLVEEVAASKKLHDSELSGYKRSASATETERGALQRKIEELTAQNQELARAISYKMRADELAANRDTGSENEDIDIDRSTPEPSPPPSPSKATPRHGQLESETLKSSLHHAHRMIQNLKNNIHREKTEKVELRRMLQDARDELDSRRGDSNGVSSAGKKKRFSNQQDVFKKPARPERLGGARGSKQEVFLDEAGWEDHDQEGTPSKFRVKPGLRVPGSYDETTSAAETANEDTDAFETANEAEAANTETDAFQTGAETLDGDSSDELTETEGTSSQAGGLRAHKPSPLAAAKPRDRMSYMSTASTSGDENEELDTKTPVAVSHPRYRLKINRGGYRKSGRSGDDSNMNTPESAKDSPASFMSERSPPAAGQSLYAELGELEGDSEEGSVADATPSRSRFEAAISSPETPTRSIVARENDLAETMILKRQTVDSSTMTEVSNSIANTPIAPQAITKNGANVESATEKSETEGKGLLGGASTAITSAIAGTFGYGLGRSSNDGANFDSANGPSSSVDESARGVNEKRAPDTIIPHGEVASPKSEALTFSSIDSRSISPIAPKETRPAPLLSSTKSPQNIPKEAPAQVPKLRYSAIAQQMTEPLEPPMITIPTLRYSAVSAQFTLPESPTIPKDDPMAMALRPSSKEQASTPAEISPQRLSASKIFSQAVEPEESSRPSTSHRDGAGSAAKGVLAGGIIGSVFGWNKNKSAPEIAEDETSQPLPRNESLSRDAQPESSARKDGREPFKQIDGNANAVASPAIEDGTSYKPKNVATLDGETQTLLSSGEIETMIKSKSHPTTVAIPPVGKGGPTSPKSSSPRKPYPNSDLPTFKAPRRPGSPGSTKSKAETPPPLPANHQEVIAAAQKSPAGAMGPPTMPASAYRDKQFRPRTPQNVASPTSKGDTTPRARPPVRSGGSAPVSRRSSMSSFASEIDHHFNISQPLGYHSHEAGGTDPRMIEAIKQTMIGEFMWKYTRKAGREDMSDKRHRRFFWIHPFTRTLYWSEKSPTEAGTAMLKAKSVAIESVQAVTDDNPMPPGLHRKSIIVLSPGRTVKFTATTAQRHETWLNVLSYLVLRHSDQDDDRFITAEDVDEFNPRTGHNTARKTRSRASLSTYNSRATTRDTSPQQLRSSTIIQHNGSTTQRATVRNEQHPHRSLSTRLSSSITGYFRPGSTAEGSVASRKSMQSGNDGSVYNATAVHDSTEDVRHVIHQQERDSDKLENVRACCDGKHDVGSLSRKGRGSRTSRHSFASVSGSGRHSHTHGRPLGPDSHLHHQNEMEASNFGAS